MMRPAPRLKLAAALLLGSSMPALAQIVTDGSAGPVTSYSGESVTIPQSVGTTAGQNLFHSFDEFNVQSGQTVTFTGDSGLRRVISRVTGGARTNINGTLRSTVGNADFYLVNPNGVTIGAGGSVDVPAGLHIATSDRVNFANGDQLRADLGGGSTFSSGDVTSFGFANAPAGDITISEATVTSGGDGDLTLTGRNITIAPGVEPLEPTLVAASGGRVKLTAAGTSRASVSIDPATATGAANGSVQVRGEAFSGTAIRTFASEGGGGGVTIDTGSLTVTQAIIAASTTAWSGGEVDIRATGEVTITDGGRIETYASGDGDAGDVTVRARNVTVSGSSGLGGSVIQSTAFAGAGDAGDVRVEAVETVRLTEGTSQTFLTGLSSEAYGSSTGATGDITIVAANVVIEGGAAVVARGFGAGDAGGVRVEAGTFGLDRGFIFATSSLGAPGRIGITATGNATMTGDNPFFARIAAAEIEIRAGGRIEATDIGLSADGYSAAGLLTLEGTGGITFTGVFALASRTGSRIALAGGPIEINSSTWTGAARAPMPEPSPSADRALRSPIPASTRRSSTRPEVMRG